MNLSLGAFVLLLVASFGAAYRIPSEDIVADVELDDLINPTYFTYKVHVVLGESVEFDVVGSTKDGDRDLIVEPLVGGPKTKYVRQQVTRTLEGGKPVIKLFLKSTVRNIQKKIKYNGFTNITYKARQGVQWFTEHAADAILNYKGEGCDPDDLECNPAPPTKKEPCVRVVRGEIDLAPATPRTPFTRTSSGGKVSVVCRSEGSDGYYRYTCDGVDPSLITISTEHILWLNGPKGCEEQVDIVIPNYRAEELIRAAIKASSASAGSTNVNILVKKPETIYDVQAQDGGLVAESKPVVNLQYEQVPKPVSLHYPTDRKYDPLTGPIAEPGQGGTSGYF